MSIKIYVKYVKNNRDFHTTKLNLPTGDYDCIIMSHSQFEKNQVSAERKERMLNE